MQQHIYYTKYALQFADQRRGIDVSAVYDGKVISFANPVRYDIIDNLLAIVG